MRRYSTPTRGNPFGRGETRAAIRWAVWFALAGAGLLIVGGLWANACGTDADLETVSCGRPARMLLGLTAPLTLGGGTLGAFARTYRVWREDGNWWAWQGAGWFLLTLTLFALTIGFPVISGIGTR